MIVRFSPAKVNLFFRVLAKRPDGFHEVASLYKALDFGDFIGVELSKNDSFISNEKSLLADSSNLVIRARDLFRKSSKIYDPIAIDLKKNIPMGAGLGGGSSNASTLLSLMNDLFNKPLSEAQMIEISAKIGSDCPFFFSKGISYCTGKGEVLSDVDFTFKRSFWIAKPDKHHLLTTQVYSECRPNEASALDPLELLNSFKEGKPIFVNDLEPAAFRLIPELKQFKRKLFDLGFSEVVMTGSGTAFICFGDVENPFLPNTSFNFVNTI
jgi:4-diphosphocytidyl-2-C-methyl-D-erythritol kinase